MLKFGEIQNDGDSNTSVDEGSLNMGLFEVYVLPQTSFGYTGYTSL